MGQHLRVAYICGDPGIPVFGSKGASVHVQEVLRVLARAGAAVDLFCVRTGGAVPPGLERLTVHLLPAPPKGDPATRERAAMRTDDILADVLARTGCIDLVYERYALWSRAGMAYARSRGIPALLEVNAPLVDEQARHRDLVHRSEADAVARDVLRDASAVVCVSEPVAAWARGRTDDHDRVHVLPNGVDTTRIRPSSPPPEPFTIGFVGTLKPWHGVDVLVDAFSRLAGVEPGIRLLLVGDGPEATRIRDRAAARGVSHAVEMTGALRPEDVPAQLHRMHVAVAPYPDDPESYFSPLKVFEYMAAGLPVVASRAGQIPDLVTDRVDGVLVPPGDIAALTHALAALRDDPAYRGRLGAAARHAAVARFTWDGVVHRSLGLAGVALPSPQQVA
jgi:glycosyltransferase involved in cell wall biosynthesis